MRVELDIEGDRWAVRKMERLAENAKHARPLMEQLAEHLREGQRQQFVSEQGWTPLAASTRERKRRQRLPMKAMVASGRLEKALTKRRARGSITRIDNNSVRVGIRGGRSPAYPGIISQAGAGQPKRIVVPEPSAATRRAMADTTLKYLMTWKAPLS